MAERERNFLPRALMGGVNQRPSTNIRINFRDSKKSRGTRVDFITEGIDSMEEAEAAAEEVEGEFLPGTTLTPEDSAVHILGGGQGLRVTRYKGPEPFGTLSPEEDAGAPSAWSEPFTVVVDWPVDTSGSFVPRSSSGSGSVNLMKDENQEPQMLPRQLLGAMIFDAVVTEVAPSLSELEQNVGKFVLTTAASE